MRHVCDTFRVCTCAVALACYASVTPHPPTTCHAGGTVVIDGDEEDEEASAEGAAAVVPPTPPVDAAVPVSVAAPGGDTADEGGALARGDEVVVVGGEREGGCGGASAAGGAAAREADEVRRPSPTPINFAAPGTGPFDIGVAALRLAEARKMTPAHKCESRKAPLHRTRPTALPRPCRAPGVAVASLTVGEASRE